jgi:hypothetical protein
MKETNGYVELDPGEMSDQDIKDEVNRRTHKAGYTTKRGECRYATKPTCLVTWGVSKMERWCASDEYRALRAEMESLKRKFRKSRTDHA